MKAFIVDREGKTSFIEVPMPKYGSCDALVRILACGLCGTDAQLLRRTLKGYPETMYPLMLGHEGVGEVIAVGSEVKSFKIGDKVLLPFVRAEDIGRPDIGSAWGALSEYGIVHDLAAYPEDDIPYRAYAQTVIDDDIDPVDAAMIVTLREVLSCIHYIGIKPGETAVVLGCGPVGLTFIKLLTLLGVRCVMASDIIPEKLAEARAFGAETAMDANGDTAAALRELFPDGVDNVINAASSAAALDEAMGLIRDRGRVICYGVLDDGRISVDASRAGHNWQLISQQFPRKWEEGAVHGEVMKWIRAGKLRLRDFISDYFDYADTGEAYRKLLAKEIEKKCIIRMRR